MWPEFQFLLFQSEVKNKIKKIKIKIEQEDVRMIKRYYGTLPSKERV